MFEPTIHENGQGHPGEPARGNPEKAHGKPLTEDVDKGLFGEDDIPATADREGDDTQEETGIPSWDALQSDSEDAPETVQATVDKLESETEETTAAIVEQGDELAQTVREHSDAVAAPAVSVPEKPEGERGNDDTDEASDGFFTALADQAEDVAAFIASNADEHVRGLTDTMLTASEAQQRFSDKAAANGMPAAATEARGDQVEAKADFFENAGEVRLDGAEDQMAAYVNHVTEFLDALEEAADGARDDLMADPMEEPNDDAHAEMAIDGDEAESAMRDAMAEDEGDGELAEPSMAMGNAGAVEMPAELG